jgi:hypothetical protein
MYLISFPLPLYFFASFNLAVEFSDAEAVELVHPPIVGGGVGATLLRLVLVLLRPRGGSGGGTGGDSWWT